VYCHVRDVLGFNMSAPDEPRTQTAAWSKLIEMNKLPPVMEAGRSIVGTAAFEFIAIFAIWSSVSKSSRAAEASRGTSIGARFRRRLCEVAYVAALKLCVRLPWWSSGRA
jgi:hypothetical protein